MEQLRLLRRRVKALWVQEEKFTPAERELHSWQVACSQGGVTYLVGKGGANTFYIRVNEGKPKYFMPEDCFKQLDRLIAKKYVMYSIGNKAEPKKRVSTSEAKLKRITSDKFAGNYLIGFDSKGKPQRLYVLKSGLRGNEWVKIGK